MQRLAKQIAIRIPQNIQLKLEEDAEREGSTISHIIRRILKSHYEEAEYGRY
jgi:predicted DNA-binding protein